MMRVSSFLKDLPRWLMMITATMSAMATVPNTPTTMYSHNDDHAIGGL